MRLIESVLHGRDAALAGYLIRVMRDRGIVDLSADLARQIMDAAREFQSTAAGKLYQEEAELASANGTARHTWRMPSWRIDAERFDIPD